MLMIETGRLVLRQWRGEDVASFAEMNRDVEVMEHMPKHEACGYGLYALELKDTGTFIGYTGFHHFDFDADFAPGIEIGWRIARRYWNQGYATEAARACISYARAKSLFNEIYSFTAVCNHRSERVMQKIGMERHGWFLHPALPDGHRLKPHVVYRLDV